MCAVEDLQTKTQVRGWKYTDTSEDVFEVFDAVGFEEHKQDECPQAKYEAVWWVPVLLLGFLYRSEWVLKTTTKTTLDISLSVQPRHCFVHMCVCVLYFSNLFLLHMHISRSAFIC